ncbi:MAG: DUF6088 family protein [Acetatifactor sp.]|nr:DUF6088 family protein [Acetatifactor sp.]
MLYEYLKEHYREGEPIFLDDIHMDGIRRDNFRQQIKTLADAGKIVRYEKGIYYLPKRTRFSSSAGPSPETVATYKYISRGNKTYGYYSGGTFANLIGISVQVPMKKEIVSNNIAAIVREIPIGKQTFIVRRTNVPISDENVRVLQLLELLKNLDAYLDDDYNEAREKIKEYSLANHITKRDIDKYIREYPDSTFRYYYEMRLDDVLA